MLHDEGAALTRPTNVTVSLLISRNNYYMRDFSIKIIIIIII